MFSLSLRAYGRRLFLEIVSFKSLHDRHLQLLPYLPLLAAIGLAMSALLRHSTMSRDSEPIFGLIGIGTMSRYGSMAEVQSPNRGLLNWLTVSLLIVFFINIFTLNSWIELEDSISGSASSEDDDSEDSDAVAALVRKAKLVARTSSPTSDSIPAPRTALTWFHSLPATQIGVYRALFSNNTDPTSYLSELKALQIARERKWALFMTAGGHFAGAVVRVSEGEETEGDIGKGKKKHKRPKPDIEVLRHKTFHRYTSQYHPLPA